MQKRNFVFILILLFISRALPIWTEERQQRSLLRQIGEEFISGIVQANYRETPIDEVLELYQMPFPELKIPRKKKHPSLLFGSEALNKIRSRRFRSPYREWADNIIEAVQTLSYDPESPLLFELHRSKVAKLNAFAYFLTRNEDFLNEAMTALTHISETKPPCTAEGGVRNEGWGDWMQAAEALRQFAVAYDLVYDELTTEEKEYIKSRLAAQTDQLYRNLSRIPKSLNSTDLAIGVGIPKNNHIVVIAIGVATVALVLDHRNSQKWFNTAISELQCGLALIGSDGTYREGAYYARYIASALFPFVLYLDNITGTNLLEHPSLNRFNRWLIDIEKPDGSIPGFDDAFPERFLYQPIGVGLSPVGNELRYLFELHQDRYSKSDPNYVEAFCAFDDRVRPSRPLYNSTIFYPEGGMTIFRGNNEIYGLFLGEPGRPDISHHDHIEPTSFTLSAFGKDFLIDAGYGPGGVSSKNREWFTSAQAHNIPLVNGLGPNQNPVWGDDLGGTMTNNFKTRDFSSSTVKASYRDAEIQRTIWFAGQSYFVVIDDLSSKFKNRYSIPWHALGEFNLMDKNQVQWKQGNILLDVEFIRTDDKPLAIVTKQGLHTLSAYDRQHTTAVVQLPRAKNQKLITLFIPKNIFEYSLRTQNQTLLSTGHATARKISSIDEGWEDIIVFADSTWECNGVQSDAIITTFRKTQFSEIELISLISASFLTIDGEKIFESNQPIDLTINFDERGWFGYLDPKVQNLSDKNGENVVIKLFTHSDPGVVLFNKKTINYERLDNSLSFQIQRAGIFEMGFIGSRIKTTEPVRQDLPILEKLSSAPDLAWEMDNLSSYENLQLRNEIIQIVGPTAIRQVDNWIGKEDVLPSVYGITSGIFGSLWNASGDFQYNLPQRFKLERNISGHRIYYYEEGFLTESGINIRHHQLSADEILYFTHERFFDDHNNTSLELNYDKYLMQSNIENYENEHAYQFDLTRENQDGWLGFFHSQNDFYDEQSNAVSFGHKGWSGDISIIQYQSKSPDEVCFFGRKRGRFLSFSLDMTAKENIGLTSYVLDNSFKVSNYTLLTFNIEEIEADEYIQEERKISTSIYFEVDKFSGILSVEKSNNQEISGSWKSTFRQQKWRFYSQGNYEKILKGDFGVSYRSSLFSWQNNVLKGKENLFLLSLYPSLIWTSTIQTRWNFSSQEFNDIVLGIYYHKNNRFGGEVHFISDEDENLIGLTGIVDLMIGRSESLQIFTTTYLEKKGKIHSYEINITQTGKSTTPGILISCDERDFLRCEGYLKWTF